MISKFSRASGVLLHPTSLPGEHGIGDLGAPACHFVDFLSEAAQKYWQVLPLGPTGQGNSPYSSYSAFAGNTNLISLHALVGEGLLVTDDLEDAPEFSLTTVDYPAAERYKTTMLRRAFDNFKNGSFPLLANAFEEFCRRHKQWLDDYALFLSIRLNRDGASWTTWEPSLAKRDQRALAQVTGELQPEIDAQKFYQFIFFRQWNRLKEYCHARRISIIGDMPIFVAHDSADVWTAPQFFKLDEQGLPTTVAGVPPDYFSETGQLWGNPLYDWETIKSDNFSWWVRRFRHLLELVDVIRIDHFRGFESCWEISAGSTTAENGMWLKTPGRELFQTLESKLGEVAIVAEDLGVITPEVEALRDEFGFPGMRVMQFGFDGKSENVHLPRNYPENVFAYTATHDNNTTVGWFKESAKENDSSQHAELLRQRENCLQYLKSTGEQINWDFIEELMTSGAAVVMIPLQDVLGLGSEARMNTPGISEGNWRWRFQSSDLTTELSSRLKRLTEDSGRNAEL